jgi:hypothetical protein
MRMRSSAGRDKKCEKTGSRGAQRREGWKRAIGRQRLFRGREDSDILIRLYRGGDGTEFVVGGRRRIRKLGTYREDLALSLTFLLGLKVNDTCLRQEARSVRTR